ncbi:7-methylxanthosine synthase 1-like [Mercurialis annua]|uniref:7-methylxanthosine synthase 1-like n=1 Tax=Mercurialis annua TaxID=3986 RepID=UPI00215E6980|nr:7-methylxanthosine synthase 1-like [Mercurialis annua]
MEVTKVLYMNEGEGENSYYRNSVYQTNVIAKARPILEESIQELCRKNMPDCLKIAEMGCSTGPNTLMPLWEIVETIEASCTELKKKTPTLQVFLNDLSGTDFNTIFKTIVPEFHEKLEKEMGDKFEHVFIAAMPGSFYGRLFPNNSLHFGHSCSSLHWISQVPEGLVSESGTQLNKGNICLNDTSPPSVRKAYLNQFENDFTTFLKCRSHEMVDGGRLVFIIFAQSSTNPHCKYSNELWQELGFALKQMVDEGKIEESKYESWNVPLYHPTAEEVKYSIEKEGSFRVNRLEQFELDWNSIVDCGDKVDVFDKFERGKCVATFVRAAAESMLISHFGDSFIEDLFHRLALRMVDRMEKGTGWLNNLVVSITKV